MSIEDKILDLVVKANPDDPLEYVSKITRKLSISKVNEKITLCNKCGICNNNIKSITYGNINADILFIMDSITKEQYDNGQDIVSPMDNISKDALLDVFKYLNRDLSEFYYCNCVNCYPYEKKTRLPNVNEINNCKGYVYKIIEIIKPVGIITLGSTSSNILSDKRINIAKDRGIEFYYNDCRVMPTYSPVFINSLSEDMKKLYIEDFRNDIEYFLNSMEENNEH